MPKITPPRLKLLQGLDSVHGGCLRAEDLKVAYRRLGTIMARDGLVQWKAPSISSRHTCLGQTLCITAAGRAIVKSYEPPAHTEGEPQCRSEPTS